MKFMAIAIALLLSACSDKKIGVYVSCSSQDDGISCTAENKSDKRVEACWNFVGTCSNGTQLLANACSWVDGNATTGTFIQSDKIRGLDACDRAISTAITNVVITAL